MALLGAGAVWMTETFATDNRIVQGVSLVFLFAATVSMVLLLGHSYLRRPPPVQQTPLAVGARIGASVTYATDAKITPEPEDVQYIGAYDSVAWEWNVKPATAGSEFITIRFRVLYGETDQALVGNTYLKVPLTVEKTAGAMLRDTAAAIGGGLVGLAGMATALGVTGGGALAYFRRLRRRRTKARESWERKRDRQRQARALLRGNSMSRDPLRIYRRPG